MIIKGIIENDNDRLFIVDNECYIVFTGDSLEDDKPFIRIGNWLDLYVEIIPLIENIIITDNISGNPLHEQFNIDVKNLQLNRYIGSQHTLDKYLEFQRLCGLDLKNASIINIEKDIPEITGKRLISKKNQFIGVFYRDSNFKVIYNKSDIVSLYDTEKISYSHNNILDRISSANRGMRYKGTGFSFNRENALLFSNGRITSIGYPGNLFSWLVEHEIDPGSIDNLVLLRENPQSLVDFLKWNQSRDSGIKLYTDLLDEAGFIKKLFSKSLKNIDNFSTLDTAVSDSIEITNFNGSGNLVLNYSINRPERENVKISYISSVKEIDELIQLSGDGIIINYTLFEDNAMRFKSTHTPVIIIDDGNPNISRLVSADNIIIFQNTEYTAGKTVDPEYILSRTSHEEELLGEILNENIRSADDLIRKLALVEDPLERNALLLNLSTLLRYILNSTADRKLSSRLKGFYTSLQGNINRDLLNENSNRLKGSLIFHNQSVYQFIEIGDESENRKALARMIHEADEYIPLPLGKEPVGTETAYFNSRIREDRERLRRLLDYFIDRSEMFNEKKEYIEELDTLLKERRKEFLIPKQDGKGYKVNVEFKEINREQLEKSIKGSKSRKEKAAGAASGNERSFFKPVNIAAVVILLILLIIGALYLTGTINTFSSREDKISETPYQRTIREIYTVNRESYPELEKKYKIRVKPSEILRYANGVAVKNGYNRISLSKLREKNPDWIFPGNVFLMLDGTRVKVKRGDTLWKLSEDKIIESIIVFNRIMEKLSQSDRDISDKLLREAKKVAFMKEHVKMINQMLKEREKSRKSGGEGE